MRILRTLFVLGGALLAATQAYAIDIDREYHETFDVEQGMRLHLEHGDGNVTVTPWDKDVLDIQVRYTAKIKKVGFGKVDTDFHADFDVEGRTIYAKGYEPSGTVILGFFTETDLHYHWNIQAPAYLLLELKGDDGDVSITDWAADIRAYMNDGNYSLTDIRGDVHIRLDDGDLTIDGLTGRLDVESQDGDTVIRNCTTDDLHIVCDDGDVLIDRASGNFDLETQDGGVELDRVEVLTLSVVCDDGRVRASEISGESPEIDIHTQDGDVRLSFLPESSYSFVVLHHDSSVRIDAGEIQDLQKDERRVSGTVGAGKGRVNIHTDDGSVTITGAKRQTP